MNCNCGTSTVIAPSNHATVVAQQRLAKELYLWNLHGSRHDNGHDEACRGKTLMDSVNFHHDLQLWDEDCLYHDLQLWNSHDQQNRDIDDMSKNNWKSPWSTEQSGP